MSGFNRQKFGKEQNFKDRRRKVDWVVRMATALSFVAWAIALAVWIVLDRASPEREVGWVTSIGRARGTEIMVRDYWDSNLLPIAFILLLSALAICVIAFFFNKARMRRKTDKYRKSVIIIGSITILGIALFLLRFGLPFSSGAEYYDHTPQAYTELMALPDGGAT